MKTKQEAISKISAAEKLIAKVDEYASAAFVALRCPSSINGYGIYHDRFEVRSKLKTAQFHIQKALKTLNEIDWPTSVDYDLL